MAAARLIDVKEMAETLGVSRSYLNRVSNRQRLEAQGCPAPMIAKPLKWSGPLVERWIRGDVPADPSAALPVVDEKEAWRARLTEQYGSGK